MPQDRKLLECPRQDLNLHPTITSDRFLRAACLPVPSRGQIESKSLYYSSKNSGSPIWEVTVGDRLWTSYSIIWSLISFPE